MSSTDNKIEKTEFWPDSFPKQAASISSNQWQSGVLAIQSRKKKKVRKLVLIDDVQMGKEL